MEFLNAGRPEEGPLVRIPALMQSHYSSQPIAAVVRGSSALTQRLRECSEICRQRRLSHLIIEGAPERWEIEGRELGLPLGEADLIVLPESFWFRDRVRGRKTVLTSTPVLIEEWLAMTASAGCVWT
ncbi:MAG: hypothetical protein JO006_16215 [Paucibacter sp.]|nr:hypothetical protein [Roseateles sp.]